jgi:hypothetical protein
VAHSPAVHRGVGEQRWGDTSPRSERHARHLREVVTAGRGRPFFDQPVAVLRGHEGHKSRRERRGGGQVVFLSAGATATATVHGPLPWWGESRPSHPSSHTRAPQPELDSPSSPFPDAPAHGGRSRLRRTHLSRPRRCHALRAGTLSAGVAP